MLAEFLRPVTFRLISEESLRVRTVSWGVVLVLDLIAGQILFSAVDCDGAYDMFWRGVDSLVARLDDLMNSLTNNPAGMKLNEPVNTALASFFQYHMHLWKTFMMFSRYRTIWYVLYGSSCLGLSVCCALFADFISLLTLHILCFDVYASRLAKVTTSSLNSLWRVFRGRKWNPLRCRTDTVRLDTRQQFITTLLFTILLFLLPTVIVYFVVFKALRLSVTTFQKVISRLALHRRYTVPSR